MIICSRHFMSRIKILTPELIDLKSAFVYIEMNIALLKIWCTGMPDNCFGMECFYCLPCATPNAFAVSFGFNKQYFQFILVCVCRCEVSPRLHFLHPEQCGMFRYPPHRYTLQWSFWRLSLHSCPDGRLVHRTQSWLHAWTTPTYASLRSQGFLLQPPLPGW